MAQDDLPMARLTRAFFARPVLEVAPELLGCTISHAGVTVRLTEVEAYDGSNDPGSHAFRGPTLRTRVMFGEPGGLYVYFTYGMHWCANLVCGSVGVANAVLLRAGEVVDGLELARSRRPGVSGRDLARGPARLAKTLALGRDQNGIDTVSAGSPFVVRTPIRGSSPVPPGPAAVCTGPRVGVSGPGGDAAAYPWRFWLEGEATVSPYRPGTIRRRKPAVRSSGR
jgi:DNA-3-methyladenine glycosylase